MKHPYGVPQKSPPADLPFLAGGVIACHTCHEPHAVTAQPHGLRMEHMALCMRCHPGH